MKARTFDLKDLSKPLDTKKTGLSIGGFSDLEVPSEARYSIHKKKSQLNIHMYTLYAFPLRSIKVKKNVKGIFTREHRVLSYHLV